MDRRVAKTKNAIRKAYLELMKEKGTTKISISDIARRADIDRKTFYLHFDSVEDMVEKYLEERLQEMVEMLEESDYLDDPFSVEVIYTVMERAQEKDLEFIELISASDAYDKLWYKLREILIKQVVELYEPETKLSKTEMTIYIDFFITGMIKIYRSWLNGAYDITFDELVHMMPKAAHEGVHNLIHG